MNFTNKILRIEFKNTLNVSLPAIALCIFSSVASLNAQTIQTNSAKNNNQMENNLLSKGTEFFITGDGCKIAYKIDGNVTKPVLILSNSIATNFYMWEFQMREFGKYFRIVRFDTRGNGLSDAPEGDYSIDRMGLDVIELLDYLKLDKVNFCGLSLGGFIGQWIGSHAPDRVNKLILVNTSSYLGGNDIWNKHISSLRKEGDMKPFEEMFVKGWFPKKMISENDSVVLAFRNMILNTKPNGLAGSFAAVRDADMRKTNALIQNKTLIIAGKYDLVTKPEHSELMASVIPNSKLIILPSVHLSNIELKDKFEKLVLDFLNEE